MTPAIFDYKTYLEGDSFLAPHKVSEVLKNNLTTSVIGEERTNLIREIQCYDFYFKNGELRPIIEIFPDTNPIAITFDCYEGYAETGRMAPSIFSSGR